MSETEVAIWSRLLQPDSSTLSPEAARAILMLDFTEEDRARLHELATRGQSGSLSAAEEDDLETYCRVGRLLDLMRSKARRSLATSGAAAQFRKTQVGRATIAVLAINQSEAITVRQSLIEEGVFPPSRWRKR